MLKLSTDPVARLPAPSQQGGGSGFSFDLRSIVTIVRQQWPMMAGITLAVILLAAIYVATARPYFTAAVNVMIDTRKNQLLQNQQIIGDQQFDSGMVESQVEIMRSESVALSVVRDLKLTDDPEFVRPGGSLLGSILSLLSDSDDGPPSTAQLERAAVRVLLQNLTAKRVGPTYVIAVTYRSPSPERAAAVANALADAYMVGELDAKYQATKRASRWLQDRIQELREQAQAADQAVQVFKTENDIVGTNRGLMSDQQLGDVNGQLVVARAATAEAKARLDRINDIARSDLPDATVADALRNEVITRLRAQFLDLAAKEADWSARYGANHTAAVNLRNQMREIKRSIADEIRRIAETYKSDYEIARTREQSLQESLNTLITQSASTGQAQVKLRDLESSAQTARNLYDTFLQRSMEATQQQTFPITDARVITAATPPNAKSHPKSLLIMAGATGLGLVLALGVALLRARLDQVFRSASDVADVTGHETLGIIPRVTATEGTKPVARVPVLNGRAIALDVGLGRHAVEAPFSRMAEALRSIKVAIDLRGLGREMKVIGLTSALPLEGKTLVSANLAMMLAQSGRRTLLIDGDLRHPSTSRLLAPHAEYGLARVLDGTCSAADAIWTDPVTGLDVLPNPSQESLPQSAEYLSSPAMAALLVWARKSYDYVVVDLPPLMPVVDVRAVSHLIDGFAFVIEWGVTSHEVVRESLATSELVEDRLLGIVLNKASPSALKRVESYKGRYYRSYYSDKAA